MVEIGLKRIEPNKAKELVLETTEDGCIICTSHSPNADGYIRLYSGKDVKKRYEMLHRLTYRKYRGEIPEGYEVDHLCRVRKCCNPEHLQILTVSAHKSKTNKERYKERTEQIIYAMKCGFKRADVASMFKVSPGTVWKIMKVNNG